MYNDEYNRKLNEANMARDRLDSDIAQYNNERNFAYGQYADEKNMAYTQLQNLISGLRYADETEYNRGQNDVANEIAQGHLANETASTNSNIAVNAQNIAASQAGVELANKEFDASEDQRAKENKQTAYNNVMQLVREGKIPDDASIEAAGFDKAYVTGLAKEYADPIARAEKISAIESAINYAINAGYVPDEIKKQSGMSDEEIGRYTALYADSKNKETRANAQTQLLNLVTNGYSAGNIPTDVKKNSGWTDAEINAMAQVGISEDAKNDKESAQAWISDWVFNGMSAASVPADILKASGWNLATVQRMVTDRKSATGNSSSASSTSGRSGGQSSKGGNNSAQVKEKKTEPVQVKETNRTQNGSYTGVDIGLGNEKYAPPSQPEVDMASVLALGRGLLSAETLANLISSGEIEQYTEDGKIKFRNRQKPGIIGMKPGGFGI
ncbi:MAG: hypothetical protein IJ299_05150 [Oscillospiraceae bacterium]|nr:hypothetical protein [Oscillospiraceae bacterium]